MPINSFRHKGQGTFLEPLRLHPTFFAAFDQMIDPELVLGVIQCTVAGVGKSKSKDYESFSLVPLKEAKEDPAIAPLIESEAGMSLH